MSGPGLIRASRLGTASAQAWSRNGYSLPELLMATAISGLIMASLAGLLGQSLATETDAHQRNTLARQADFALQRMIDMSSRSTRLLLPLADNPATDWREHVREQTVPPSPPEGSASFATAVLALTLGPSYDFNEDGWADANNDKDFLDRNNNGIRDPGEAERIDEDLGSDNTNDGANGIIGIDDNGNGTADDGAPPSAGVRLDDDEDGSPTEDRFNGIDDDGDGSVDEDTRGDMNADGSAGIAGVDDDLDGTIDEGIANNDDEDGSHNEDWYDPVVYYLNGDSLIERLPSTLDIDGDGALTGKDFTEAVIARPVSRFRVERIASGDSRPLRVDITLELADPLTGEITRVQTQVRLGGG